MAGLVLGNPDQKKNFAIKVSFPRDMPIKATQWLAPGGNKSSMFQFKTDDLELIVIDGTLNRGMSGGPVIVGDKAIGIFSGGEQTSGAGLAWAIPLKYLQKLATNQNNLPANQLPRLSMLGRGNSSIVPLKRTSFVGSGKIMEASLQLSSTLSEFERAFAGMSVSLKVMDALCHETVDVKSLEADGESSVDIETISRDNWMYCASMFYTIISKDAGNYQYVDGAVKLSSLADKINLDFENFSNLLLSEIEEKILSMRAIDIKSGYFRRVKETISDCAKIDKSKFAKSFKGFASGSREFNKRLEYLSGKIENGQFGTGNVDQIFFKKLGSDIEFREIGRDVVAARKTLELARFENLDIRERYLQCASSVIAALESRNTQFHDSKNFELSDLDKTEAAYVGGAIFGSYVAADAIFSLCEKINSPKLSFLRDYHAKWRAEWFSAYKKSSDILKAAGLTDADLMGSRNYMRMTIENPMAAIGVVTVENCAAINSENIPLIDSLAYNSRMREFAEMLDVIIPPKPQPDKNISDKLRLMIEPIIGNYFSRKSIAVREIDAIGMKKFIAGFQLVGISDSITRQAEQCKEWFPEKSESIDEQVRRWFATNQTKVNRAIADVRSMLSAFSQGESASAVAADEKHMRERLSIELLQAVQHDVGMDAIKAKAVCDGLISRINDFPVNI